VAATVSFALALAASVAWMLVPASTSVSTVASTSGVQHGPTVTHETLVAATGWRVLWVLAVPVAIAGIGLAARRRWALMPGAVLLWLFVVATGFSIGLSYLPAAAAMVVAAAISVSESGAT
jgi:hypothetical protein